MRAAGSGLAADETIGMSAAGATHQPSRQKPRFLPAAHGVMSAEIAPQAPQAPRTNPAGKNHAFCQRRTERCLPKLPQAISANRIIIRALFTAEDP
jgi:hypothetical protein